jgi:hypothetical protein
MNPDRIRQLSPAAYAQLVDAAKARALEARREAIDAFWSAVARRGVDAWGRLRRGVGPRRAQRASWG